MTLHALESAAFAAWPALDEAVLAGWRVRHADGYTQRANSANATAAAAPLDDALVGAIEAAYRARGRPAIFRLASLTEHVEADDRRLADLGYRFCDVSLVMTRRLDGSDDSPDGREADGARPSTSMAMRRATLDTAPDAAAWLAAYRAITGASGPGQDTHLRMLQAIRGATAYGWHRDPARAIACALAVAQDGLLGLFDVATHVDHRRAGLSTQLCHGLMAWGRVRGATQAYLQVVAANANAIRLYERLGFRRAYHYWYRVATA